MNARGADANLALLAEVAARLGVLRDTLVFVGGCATGLLATAPRAQSIRVTLDVDLVAEVATLAAYHELERQFEALGFVHDVSAGAPICRWRMDHLVVDLMPSRSEILGFANPWYPMAIASAQRIALPETDLTILLIRAPEFVATKLVAFKDRGRGDYLASHDLEDLVTVVDGRETLHDEVVSGPQVLRSETTTSSAPSAGSSQATQRRNRDCHCSCKGCVAWRKSIEAPAVPAAAA
jgi:predicted nucleotidyltransferase